MRELGIICVLLTALAGCENSWSKDPQFQKQVKRAQECRQLQDKLAQASEAGREEITKSMKAIGCTAPAAG
jgi:crotonobetainyl-CoA:carnitine CoA-transferase CaiB-like acyl-CoA transferase